MIKEFFVYLRHRRLLLLFYGASGAIVLLVQALSGQEMQFAWYIVFLISAVLAALLLADGLRFTARRRTLRQLGRRVQQAAACLPPPISPLERDYQELLRSLDEEFARAKERSRAIQGNNLSYYTLWVHQIKTPIAAIDLLLQEESSEDGAEGARPAPAEARDYAARRQRMSLIRQELFQIQRYADLALQYVKIGDVASDLVIERCDLNEIARQCVKKYSLLFIYRGLSVEIGPLNAGVKSDRKWLAFIIEQILSNAVKYTRTGGVRIYLKEGAASPGGPALVIADSGVGIRPEDLPRVFEKGYTGYNGRVDQRASGIGLFLARQAASALSIRLSAESRLGEGTAVTIHFPDTDEFIFQS